MTLVFLVFTFPYDMLIRKKMKDLEKTLFRTVYISEIDFSLIRMIELNNIYMVLRSGGEITIRSADINISFLRLLFRNDIKGTVDLTGFKYESETSKINFNLQWQHLHRLQVIQLTFPREATSTFSLTTHRSRSASSRFPTPWAACPSPFPRSRSAR